MEKFEFDSSDGKLKIEGYLMFPFGKERKVETQRNRITSKQPFSTTDFCYKKFSESADFFSHSWWPEKKREGKRFQSYHSLVRQ